MIDIDFFKNAKGKLNPNWRKLVQNNPDKFDRSAYDASLDDNTVMKLAMLGLTELPKCKVCSNPAPIGSLYCSRKCSANDPEVKQKKVSNTDVEARTKKISSALKGRNDYHQKVWDTRRERYGDKGTSEAGIYNIQIANRNIDLAKRTCLSRYGVDNASKSPEVKQAIRKIALELKTARLHLPDWLYDRQEFTHMYNSIGHQGIVDKAKCSHDLVYRLEVSYGIRDMYRSSAEIEIVNFLESLTDTEIITNSRKIIPNLKELDIYVPAHKLAIEYDGIFWHSSGSKETDLKIKHAHISKTEECEKQGIHLLHIFENEWRNPIKREIWKSVISHKLGKSKSIYARKCVVRDISVSIAHEFCEENHLQGKCGASSAKGLFYNGELVQVATFGKPRFNKGYDMELLRLCSKKYTCVVGGASKLLKGMNLISYANRRWSFGNVYEQMGMEKVGVTKPGYFYIVDGELKHRSGYMKHVLKDKLEIFDEELSESENCYANGLRRIWDCGNILYKTKKGLK
ncbi:putative Hef-like homing endonuclease [Acinetobacter phage KARL-1]|uniref:Putative Hef-like homing endonuclease n=1 Tax=Acinetobacter phage KARL-1 TaxID=2301662 RepID=A0A385IIJ8_9CAUD|nr:homing endonuclease [Acinetobacter phage KARL-1]AXY82718.1 putative Hef-like homing endonuclease [Acinetobacter phage KARL-1]